MQLIEALKENVGSKPGQCYYSKKCTCFIYVNEEGKQVRLKGLTVAARSILYPKSSTMGVSTLNRYEIEESSQVEEPPLVATTSTRNVSYNQGARRGAALDRNIAQAVAQVAQRQRFKSPCRATTHVMTTIQKMGLHPVSTQVPVHGMEKGLRVGTAVDILCVKRNDPAAVIIIEVKTGFANRHTGFRRNMLGPLCEINDSPRSQHHLQLGCTMRLFQSTMGIAPQGAYLFRVLANGVEVAPLDSDIMRAVPKALGYMKAAIVEGRNKSADYLASAVVDVPDLLKK